MLSQIINTWPNSKLLNYKYLEQLKDIAPSIFLAIVMGFFVFWVSFIPLPDILVLIIQISVGASIYIGLSAVLRLEQFEYIWSIIREIIKNNGGDCARKWIKKF